MSRPALLEQSSLRPLLVFHPSRTPERRETCLHRLFMAALLALYGPHPGMFPVAAPELMKTRRPPCELLRSSGSVARMAVTREKKLTSKCCFHCSMGTPSEAILPIGSSTPAFRMTPSMPSYFSTPRDTAEPTAAASVLRSSLRFQDRDAYNEGRTRHIPRPTAILCERLQDSGARVLWSETERRHSS